VFCAHLVGTTGMVNDGWERSQSGADACRCRGREHTLAAGRIRRRSDQTVERCGASQRLALCRVLEFAMTEQPPPITRLYEESPVGGALAARAAENADLRDSLDSLSRLAVAHLELQDLLTRVATYAVRAIPGAEGAGLTLFQDSRPDTIVASADFVREVDAIQYSIGEGPCITAAAEKRTVRSGALTTEPAWPKFGPKMGRLGVNSVMSLPLLAADEVLGAMNVYAHPCNAFHDDAVTLGELFAIPAAISVHNARALAQARTLATQLNAALASRPIIDQALGILMSRTGCASEEAFDKLRVMSQSENRKVSVIAQQLVDEAVRRARARHS
jgi:GAF domain-containing protein